MTFGTLICLVDPAKRAALFIRRKKPPFQNLFSLPGGKFEEKEDALHCAIRELKEETGVSGVELDRVAVIDLVRTNWSLWYYVGFVRQEDVPPSPEDFEYIWISVDQHWNDVNFFAGDGVLEAIRVEVVMALKEAF